MAKAATTNIPIVFLSGDDPVANGLVASLNRPGGNVTGISLISGVLGGKQLGVLHELIPSARSIAFLTNPTNPISTEYVTGAQEAARSLGAEIHVVSASTEAEGIGLWRWRQTTQHRRYTHFANSPSQAA